MNRPEDSASPPVPPEKGEISDQKLIEACQQGDKKAYGQIVRRHQKRLFRFIYGLTGSFDKTEDVVQEAFVKGYLSIASFRAGSEFYPWISVIARNLAYNLITREGRKQSLDALTDEGYDPATHQLGPFEQLVSSAGEEAFFKAVAALPAPYRSVFVLRQFEQMDYSQIASYLKIPPGTVDSRLFRARQMLLEALKDHL